MEKRGILLLLTCVFLVACTSQTMQPTTQTPVVGGTETVTTQSGSSNINIQNFAFNPNSITISAGTTVTWTNNDPYNHQIASDTGAFGSDPLQTGSTYSFTFKTAGTYSYHCAIHPSMTGTIIVQ